MPVQTKSRNISPTKRAAKIVEPTTEVSNPPEPNEEEENLIDPSQEMDEDEDWVKSPIPKYSEDFAGPKSRDHTPDY